MSFFLILFKSICNTQFLGIFPNLLLSEHCQHKKELLRCCLLDIFLLIEDACFIMLAFKKLVCDFGEIFLETCLICLLVLSVLNFKLLERRDFFNYFCIPLARVTQIVVRLGEILLYIGMDGI